MAGGRPTEDPKETLVAVRLAARQRALLERRMRSEHIGLSKALRRCLDDWARWTQGNAPSAARGRAQMTPDERETFDQVFAALGLTPAPRRARPRRRR
jgi:hypothetical protein